MLCEGIQNFFVKVLRSSYLDDPSKGMGLKFPEPPKYGEVVNCEM